MSLKTIFTEGRIEWRRRRSLSRGNSSLKSVQATLSGRLQALGQKAWSEKIDIGAHKEIKENLDNSQAKLDELQKSIAGVSDRVGEKEQEKKKEIELFTGKRQEVEARKKEIDARLRAEKDTLSGLQKELAQSEGRKGQIAREREQLQKKVTDPVTTPEQRATYERGLQELAMEEANLLGAIKLKNEEILAQSKRVNPLQGEVNEIQKQINENLAQQKERVAVFDKELAEIGSELDNLRKQEEQARKLQNDSFELLGRALAASGDLPASLAGALAAVRESEREISSIQASIANLDSQKSEAGTRAYKKMMALIWGGVLLLVVLVVAAFMLLKPKPKSPLQQVTGGMIPSKTIEEAFTGGRSSGTKAENSGPVATAQDLGKVLNSVDGWEMSPPDYSKVEISGMETSTLRSTYSNVAGMEIEVEITDTHSVAAMLAPAQSIFTMRMELDDEQFYQQTGRLNGIPMVERLDKATGRSRITLIVRERYLVHMRTDAENGLDLLKGFVSRLDISALQ